MARGSFTLLLLANTIFYVAVTLTFNILAGLGVALLRTLVAPRLAGVFPPIWLLPRTSPSVVYRLMWTGSAAAPPYRAIKPFFEPYGGEGPYWTITPPLLIMMPKIGCLGST